MSVTLFVMVVKVSGSILTLKERESWYTQKHGFWRCSYQYSIGNCKFVLPVTYFQYVYVLDSTSCTSHRCTLSLNTCNVVNTNYITVPYKQVFRKLVIFEDKTSFDPDGILVLVFCEIVLIRCLYRCPVSLTNRCVLVSFLMSGRCLFWFSYTKVVVSRTSLTIKELASYRVFLNSSTYSDRIVLFIDKTSYIVNEHRFFRGRSTASNLFLFCSFVNTAFEANQRIDCICIDLIGSLLIIWYINWRK